MPVIIRPSATPGHAPETTYCLATVPLDSVLADAAVAVIVDVGLARRLSGSSNISTVVIEQLRQIEARIAAGALE